MAEWEPVIGLEVHAHLKTETKMFCRCTLEYGAPENTRTCPVCLAHPGALPVANGRAIEHTITVGLALGCEISPHAIFARKNYFYPDLPKGYQISQYEAPLCGPGRFVVPTADGDELVGIVRAAYERGEELEQSTYDYDPDTDRLTVHRSKEEADDYRYFPEPDLVPLEPPPELVERLREAIGELPAARIRRLERELDFDLAYELVASGRDTLYERLLDSTDPRAVANAVMNEIAAANLDPAAVNAGELAKVVAVKGDLPRDVYTTAISS